jgi:glycosyltransferase involved in cell wall biosynthesis
LERTIDVSAVIPVFDEIESLPAFHRELMEAAPTWTPGAFEIVYVDDGSTDGTPELLEKLHRENPDVVRVVTLRRNFGKSGALSAGFRIATGSIVVMLDADGQDVPGEVGKLLERLETGADMVGGWRHRRKDRPIKRWTSRWYNSVTRWLTGLPLHDFNTGMKAFRHEVVDEVPLYGEFHRFVPVLAHGLGFRVDEVEVQHRERLAGRSKYLSVTRFPKTLLDLVTVLFLTRFSERPVYLFGGLGMFLALLGGGAILYLVLIQQILGVGIGTRPLLQLGVVTLLVGVQFIGVGLIAALFRHMVAAREEPYRIRQTRP